MEKDIGEIPKNEETKILLRVDNFGGQPGLTIREFVTSQRYTGFTKAGVRIKANDFQNFKKMINSINEEDIAAKETTPQPTLEPRETNTEEAGITEEGLM